MLYLQEASAPPPPPGLFGPADIIEFSAEVQMICQLFGVCCHQERKENIQRKGGKQNVTKPLSVILVMTPADPGVSEMAAGSVLLFLCEC